MDSVTLVRMIVTAMSGFLIGTTAIVCVQYYYAWRKRKADWRGLLPLHVFVVTLSYDLLLIYSSIEISLRVGNGDAEITWRMFILVPAYALGLAAMYTIAVFRRNDRLRAHV